MSTASAKPIEKYLRDYSAYVEFFDVDVGDTHELLGTREILRDRSDELSTAQIQAIRAVDDAVLKLSETADPNSWDGAMLLKTADVIRKEKAGQRIAA